MQSVYIRVVQTVMLHPVVYQFLSFTIPPCGLLGTGSIYPFFPTHPVLAIPFTTQCNKRSIYFNCTGLVITLNTICISRPSFVPVVTSPVLEVWHLFLGNLPSDCGSLLAVYPGYILIRSGQCIPHHHYCISCNTLSHPWVTVDNITGQLVTTLMCLEGVRSNQYRCDWCLPQEWYFKSN